MAYALKWKRNSKPTVGHNRSEQQTCSIADQLVPVCSCVTSTSNQTIHVRRNKRCNNATDCVRRTPFTMETIDSFKNIHISHALSCSIHIRFDWHFVTIWFMRLEKWNCQSPHRMVFGLRGRIQSKEKKSAVQRSTDFVLTASQCRVYAQYLLNYALQLQ